MAQTYIPVARYRSSFVSNGGSTIQGINTQRVLAQTVTNTKNLTDTTNKNLTTTGNKNLSDTTTRALTETIQADVGGNVSFVVKIPNILPVLIPQTVSNNPHTT